MKILRLLMLPLGILRSFSQAFICMTIHRNLQMIHVAQGKHEIICKTCKGEIGSIKNKILTFWYFRPNWYNALFFLFMTPTAAIHQWLTGRPGHFEHPLEHSN